MDNDTRIFIEKLRCNSVKDVQCKIHQIGKKYTFCKVRSKALALVRNLFHEVDTHFYNGELSKRLNLNRIKFTTTNYDVYMQCVQYTSTDNEYLQYDFMLQVNIFLISRNIGKQFYSGGYVTGSPIEFIVLMLLHESIHMIEGTDSYLNTIEWDHTVLFYRIGYRLYKMASQFSTDIDDDCVLCPLNKTLVRKLDRLKHVADSMDGEKYLGDTTGSNCVHRYKCHMSQNMISAYRSDYS